MKKIVCLSLVVFLCGPASAQVQSCVLPYSQVLTTIGAHQDANLTSLKTDFFFVTILAGIGFYSFIKNNLRTTAVSRYSTVGSVLVGLMGAIHYARLQSFLWAEKDYGFVTKLLVEPDSPQAEKVLTDLTKDVGLDPTESNKKRVAQILTEGMFNGRFCPDRFPMTYDQVKEVIKINLRLM